MHGDFKVLSSAVYNGGFVKTSSTIINLNVSEDFHGDAFAVFNSFIEEKKLEREKVVGMMTAVSMENAVILKKEGIMAVITAGMPPSKSTINIILLIEKDLSQSAMVNTIIVATEAKTAALFDLDVHDEQGDLFTGDSTDSVVVACKTFRKSFIKNASQFAEAKEEVFAGKATRLGSAVYDVVREGIKEAFFRHNRLRADRPILKRLEERGIVADELIGIDIAEYIGGKKALFNFFYYDTRKPGILSRLGVFMDDAIGGLIAGCMSRMLG